MSPNLWRVQKGPKVRRPFSYSPSEPNLLCCAHPKNFTKKNKDILETEVEDAKSRHVAFVQLPEARWSTAVCQTGIEKEWKKPKLLSNWGQITPGRQICWIYYLDLFDSLPALLLLLLYESVRWKSVSKKRKTGFIIKTESRPQATPFDECQPNCIKMCKKMQQPSPAAMQTHRS